MQILVAEDDPVNRHLLQSTLRRWGYAVTVAANGAIAWALFGENDFSLVITDQEMPVLGGLDLVRRIRARPGAGYVYVILLAASSDRSEIIAGLEAGADDFISKPFHPAELQVRLRTGERLLRLEQALLEQNRLLRDRNAEMEADLRTACEVQLALLPQDYPRFPRHVPVEGSHLRFFDRYWPNGAVGGDFFSVLPLSDTLAGVFICDVMGHGVRAALVTAMVRALLEGLRPLAGDPGRFLAEMNRELLAIFGKAAVPVFLSAFYATIDTTTGHLAYANAGHPVPILARRSETRADPLGAVEGMPGPPLAVRDDARYAVAHAALIPGDLLLLFTDGLFEAIDAEGESFGEDRLLEVIRRNLDRPVNRLFDDIHLEVATFSAGQGFSDDVCLLGMEVISRSSGRDD
jgi:phosphoserine phosphatase RsbU/P